MSRRAMLARVGDRCGTRSREDTPHSAPARIYDRSGTWFATLHAGADANLAHDLRIALGQ